MRLFGSRTHVCREGVEWWRPSGVCSSAFSQRLCAPALLASVATRVPTDQPTVLCSRSGFHFKLFEVFFFFSYTAGGVISGCVKMSEHDCWSKNVQTRCVSRIVNQQLLILGKQSSPQPGCVGLAPMHRFHQRGKRCVFISFPIYFFLLCYFSLSENPFLLVSDLQFLATETSLCSDCVSCCVLNPRRWLLFLNEQRSH